MNLAEKKILVTGGAGFLGSHVVEKLKEKGAYEIIVPRSAEYDLTDWRETVALFGRHSFDLVIHLAAKVGGIGFNRENPMKLCRDNLLTGIHLLDVAMLYEIPKVVVVGTACSYPKFASVPFREEELWSGYPEETNAPYGIAKKTIMALAQAYREERGCNFISLIPANLYGPRDNFDLNSSHVIPALIRKFYSAKKDNLPSVVLWGDGTPTREFLFVEDAAEGIVLAAKNYNEGEPINLASNSEISIADLANEIKSLISYEGEIIWDATKPNGQLRRRLDNSKAKEKFGFEAHTTLKVGLQRTIQYFESQKDVFCRSEN